MSNVEVDERVTDEIEALGAILLDNELKVKENERGIPEFIETLVFPSTGEDSQSQYVCVTLVVYLSPGYPDVSPVVTLKNPRGLDEDNVKQIQQEVEEKCNDFIGQPVMFELIELVREHLTRSNLPTGQCAICLYGFREGDEFTKTECYHHFHSHCLAAHVAAAEKYYREELEKLPQWQQDFAKEFQAICPVCRESINCNVESLCSAAPPIDVETATEFSVTAELRELQRQMSVLFIRQQQRGGIIDPEADGTKMLLRTEDDSVAGAETPTSPAGPSLSAFAANSHVRQHQVSEPKHSTPHQQSNTEKDKQSSEKDNRGSHNYNNNNHHHHHHHHGRKNRGRGRGGYESRRCERLRQNETTPR